MSIIVTGATGQFGRLVTDLLLERVPAADVTLVTRNPAALARQRELGMTVRYGDFDDPDTLPAAFAGGDRMLLISTLSVGRRAAQHQNAIDAAVSAGVKQIVYTSSGGADPANPAIVIPDHLATEAGLKSSGVSYTILRDSLYSEVVAAEIAGRAVAAGKWITCAGEGRCGFVSKKDCVAVAATVLTTPGHEGMTYEVTGPETLSFRDAARMAAEISGRPVEYIVVSDEEFDSMLAAAGVPKHYIEGMFVPGTGTSSRDDIVSYERGIRGGYFEVKSDHVHRVLGRPPTSFHDILLANKVALTASTGRNHMTPEKFNSYPTPGGDGPQVLPHSPFVPFDPNVQLYVGNTFPHAVPYEHTDWRDETMAWKETCYLNGNLNPSPTFRFKGPDALKFLSDTCVNGFANFPVNSGKHAIMCNKKGQVMMDGVLVRLAEDEFITYWLAPYMPYALAQGNYDVKGEDLTGKVFLFQLAGPRSLEILEKATGADLHDVRFMRQGHTEIRRMEFDVLRMGMAGTLAYELHGRIEDAIPVYNALLKAGAEFGIKRLGQYAYMMNHTEDGFPQAYYHFPYPWADDPGFVKALGGKTDMMWSPLRGSMGPDINLRYRTPVELGWAKMIKFDHDFVGRAALEKEVANPRRRMVTLVWSVDDIMDIHASQYQPGTHYPPMDAPNHFVAKGLFADQVLKNGKLVGISSGRAYSYNYRQMLSLCSIDVEQGDLGNEVSVLWGDPGTRQKQIRAVVSRFPYLDEGRNQTVDVSTIPRVTAAK